MNCSDVNCTDIQCSHGVQNPSKSDPIRRIAEGVVRLSSHARHSVSNKIMAIARAISSTGIITENTKNAPALTEPFQERMRRDWFDAIRRFDEERDRIVNSNLSSGARAERLSEARSRLEDSWRASIRRGYEDSFRAGYASRGNMNAGSLTTRQISNLSPTFDKMVENQARFASQFAQQYAEGALSAPGRMGVGPRSELYFRSLKGGFNMGAVDGGSPGDKIYWKLGACDHCVDCPVLAASGPYYRHKLPTVPGNGQTKCKSNCCCYLVFVKGPAPATGPAPDGQLDAFANPEMGVPPGFNTPTVSDIAHLRDLEMRRNFARRKIAELDEGPAKDGWLKQRRELQRQMNDYKKDRNLHYTPRFSVGDTISGTDISLRDVDDIFLRGLDGTTISRADVRSVNAMLDKSNQDLASALDLLKIPGPSPVVPSSASTLAIQNAADDYAARFKEFMGESEQPKMMNQWTINVVGCGLRSTLKFHMEAVREIAESETPYFVEVGPLDDQWKVVVTASGSWIRGGYEDVRRLLEALNRKGLNDFMVAPYIGVL